MNFRFIWYKNVGGTFVRFVTIHACDGETDGQTARRSPRPRLHTMQRGNINDVMTVDISKALTNLQLDVTVMWQ